jgi:hypothetical protein
VIHFYFFLVLTIAAASFALLEIQIEGPYGWASRLPTWRVENRWTRVLLGARTLTGYHLYAHLFVAILLHVPFALGFVAPSLRPELRILSFLILFWIIEDFLWFVLNPEFGVRKFNREHAWWHAPTWWWIMPREYWVLLPVGLAFYFYSWS